MLFPGKKEKANKTLIEQTILEKYNQYYRLAYSYVHNEADAYDIVQSGTYKALRSSHTLKQPEYVQTWIYRIMLNECFTHTRAPGCLSYEAMREENNDKAVIILKYLEDENTNPTNTQRQNKNRRQHDL